MVNDILEMVNDILEMGWVLHVFINYNAISHTYLTFDEPCVEDV